MTSLEAALQGIEKHLATLRGEGLKLDAYDIQQIIDGVRLDHPESINDELDSARSEAA